MVSLLPGTHHLKFIVDDQIKLTEDYPRAVDDRDGSLANYVAVAHPSSSGSPQRTQLATPLASPHHTHPNQFNSFWSDSTGAGGAGTSSRDAAWTTTIPQELVAAAAEEEAYLASADSPTSSASGVPTPNIPPAPALPRHLDKLILNVRPPAMAGPVSSSTGTSERDKRRSNREKERQRRERERARATPLLGADGAPAAEDGVGPNGPASLSLPPPLLLPVVTASGTDVTAQMLAQQPPTPPAHPSGRPWDGPGISDDASVLPVPSHVVLHHLSTSAIRNGVLAVANTTRYKKKVRRSRFFEFVAGCAQGLTRLGRVCSILRLSIISQHDTTHTSCFSRHATPARHHVACPPSTVPPRPLPFWLPHRRVPQGSVSAPLFRHRGECAWLAHVPCSLRPALGEGLFIRAGK